MSQEISDSTLSLLSAFVAREMGLLFPKKRWRDLERGVTLATRQLGFGGTEECVRWLLSAPLTRPQIEVLAGFLTVGETFFFRDPRTFEIAAGEILPGLMRLRRGRDQRLRIWSAGCSTGEEPYSIAILMHRLLPDLENWNVAILATDINTDALRRGMSGVYGMWSFRDAPPWLKTFYFTPEGKGEFRVAERIRRMVSFEYLNLAEDSYPSLHTNTNAMDLIFCRNVLMYFTLEMRRKVIKKLHGSLVENGWLMVGAVESQRSYEPFEAVRFDSVTCYRKGGGEQPAPPASVRPASEEPPQAPPAPAAQPPRQPQPQGGAVSAAEPLTAPPSYEEAAAFYRQGLYAQAADLLAELAGHGKLPAEAMTLLINSHANLGELAEALRVCEEALRRDKLDPALHYLRAGILQEQGVLEEARASLRHALYLDPKLVLAHFVLGNLALLGGEAETASKHFNNALALLSALAPEDILPGSEGMTAGRLREIIRSMTATLGTAEGISP